MMSATLKRSKNTATSPLTRKESSPASRKNRKNPQGTLAAVAVYYYSPAVLSLLRTYLAAGNNPDQPGRFVQWLYTRKPVKTFQIKGKWLDIGSKETLENADRILGVRLVETMNGESVESCDADVTL